MLLVEHATMAEVDELEATRRRTDKYQRDWQLFRNNLRRTGGCLLWDQSLMAGNSWPAMEKKFENQAVLALGTSCFEAFLSDCAI